MTKRKYNVNIIIEGLLYDTQRILSEGDTRRALELLESKTRQIRQMEKADYIELQW